jgi:hypothetical protein
VRLSERSRANEAKNGKGEGIYKRAGSLMIYDAVFHFVLLLTAWAGVGRRLRRHLLFSMFIRRRYLVAANRALYID